MTAQLDEDDVVRAIQVERLFPWVDAEVFRRALVDRYGPVTLATQAGSYLLGWGPEIPPRMRNGSSASTALTAHYLTYDGFRSRTDNSLPRIRIMLRLVDAAWANARAESR